MPINIPGESVLIDDYMINTDAPPFDHGHNSPQFTIYEIEGFFPTVHGFWLDMGGANYPFIGHNKT